MTHTPLQTARLIVLGGYLGAGKTTLLNALLRDGRLGRTAVVVNDFGSVNIDADLIEAVDDDVMQLTNGCICCQISTDMIDTMAALARMNRFDTVLCEVSGVGQPERMRRWGDFPGFHSGPVVIVANVKAIPRLVRDQYVSDVVTQQLGTADIVVLSGGTVAPGAVRHQAAEVSAKFASKAPVLEWTGGETLPDWFIQTLVSEKATESGSERAEDSREVVVPEHSVAHATATVRLPTVTSVAHLADTLTSLAPALARAKGHVRDSDGNLHSVQLANRQVTHTEVPGNTSAGEDHTDFVLIAAEPGAMSALLRAVETIAQSLNVTVHSLGASFLHTPKPVRARRRYEKGN